MPLVQWNPSFSVQVKEMDAQHQVLIEIVNQLHEAMRAGKGSQEIGAIVDQMIAYSQRHFQQEEQLLANQQYPGLLHQKGEHRAFIQKAQEFKQKAAQGQAALSVTVSGYLKDWWTNHIQVEDKKYSQYLNTRGIA